MKSANRELPIPTDNLVKALRPGTDEKVRNSLTDIANLRPAALESFALGAAASTPDTPDRLPDVEAARAPAPSPIDTTAIALRDKATATLTVIVQATEDAEKATSAVWEKLNRAKGWSLAASVVALVGGSTTLFAAFLPGSWPAALTGALSLLGGIGTLLVSHYRADVTGRENSALESYGVLIDGCANLEQYGMELKQELASRDADLDLVKIRDLILKANLVMGQVNKAKHATLSYWQGANDMARAT